MNAQIENNKQESLFLQIKSKTWDRDSHGLFDYENTSVKFNDITTAKTGFIIRRKHEVKFFDDYEYENDCNSDDKELLKIQFNNNRFYLCNNIETNQNINNDTLTYLQEKIWHVIKSNNINYANCPDQKNFVSDYKYSLKKNDIIKLGRIKFIVKEINILGKNVQITNEIFKNYKECEYIENLESNICRICLQSSVEENNPMISICKCKGSMNLIHLKCQNIWLQHKVTTREMTKNLGVTYTVKAYNCEICREPYPISIIYNGISYNLLNYPIPENQNFVVLESLNSIKENQYPLSIHILLFCENDFYILGRGHDSDLRISDISVSRVHSKIYFKDDKFFLEDCGSKFGTLVLVKDELEINDNNKILQIGRTLISTSISNRSINNFGNNISNNNENEYINI